MRYGSKCKGDPSLSAVGQNDLSDRVTPIRYT